jgi:LacI family transcriptional regulator
VSHAKEPILRDVAAMAEVSIKTASRVLNADPRVAPATRAKVLAAMAELEYRPDPAARSLRAGRDRSVGVVVDSIGDVFVATLVASIETLLAEAGYQVLIASSHREVDRERAIVHDLMQRRCAGIIVMPSSPDSLDGLRLGNLPVVFVDRVGDFPGSQSVVVNDFDLARLATQHLIDHGHQRIGILSDSQSVPTTRARHEGYCAAMESAGLEIDPAMVRDDCLDERFVLDALTEVFANEVPPTALISTNTRLSLGVVPALHMLARMDTAFVAFGDFPMAESLSPAITVIDHSPRRLGQVAADTLLERLRGVPTDAVAAPVVVPASLIPRGSGELSPSTRSPAAEALGVT